MQKNLFFNSSKGQLKMFETMGVLIVFLILLTIGVSVYFTLQKSSYTKDALNRQQLQSFELVQKMLYMPELDCINVIGSRLDNCFDKIKIEKLKNLLQTQDAKDSYYKTFGLSTININIIYPFSEELKIYDRTLQSYTKSFKTQSPIIIKDPASDKNLFGYVEITSYVQ